MLRLEELQPNANVRGIHQVHYWPYPFQREPDFHVTSVNYNFPELLARAEPPR